MSEVTENQPDGTPTWLDLGVPDLDRAMAFYGALFGWEFEVGPEEAGRYTICLLRGLPVAALSPHGEGPDFWWNVYLATADAEATAARATAAGAELLMAPVDVLGQGVLAMLRDPVGAQFGLWQGKAHLGCRLVNEPNTLVRNDLVTPDPAPAREFYAEVFGFTVDRNTDLVDADHTFLRRPDGHEIGGVMGEPDARVSRWGTAFGVADVDTAVGVVREHGGTVLNVVDLPYTRLATVADPFGAEFSLGVMPAGS